MLKIFNKESGFNLIEILITLVIICSVLLPIIWWQNESLSQMHSASQQTMAFLQTQNLLERLRANANVKSQEQELSLWQAELKYYLAEGAGSYQCSETHSCRIEIEWQEHGKKNFTMNAIL